MYCLVPGEHMSIYFLNMAKLIYFQMERHQRQLYIIIYGLIFSSNFSS